MNWLEVTIYTSKQGLETITGILLQMGVTGFVIEDPDDFEEFLTLRGQTWDYMDVSMEDLKDVETNIKFYLAENSQGQETFIEIKNMLGRLKEENMDYGSLRLELGNVKEEDWANNWKQYFKPFTVGEKFVIKPTWEAYDEATDRHILEIDPNSSFGTGQHYTTQLCIEQLENIISPSCNVLDMGCGSGILDHHGAGQRARVVHEQRWRRQLVRPSAPSPAGAPRAGRPRRHRRRARRPRRRA